MNLTKQRNVKFQHKSIKRRLNNFEEYTQPLIGEFETDYHEIISRKRKITDNIPGEYFKFELNNFYSDSFLLSTNREVETGGPTRSPMPAGLAPKYIK